MCQTTKTGVQILSVTRSNWWAVNLLSLSFNLFTFKVETIKSTSKSVLFFFFKVAWNLLQPTALARVFECRSQSFSAHLQTRRPGACRAALLSSSSLESKKQPVIDLFPHRGIPLETAPFP